jgi:glycosyltransferase involved in cell wall biosynthesis
MKISFVIPAYNEAGYIQKCLDAIIRETRGRNDVEIIVVDNNSTDRTGEIVSKYSEVKLIHEARRGANRTRETGFQVSQGEFVAFIDADTEMPHGWVEQAEREFIKNKKIICVSGPFIYYDLPMRIRALVRVFYYLAYLTYLGGRIFLRRATVIQGGNYIVRREALKAIGGHNADITFYGDDTDLAVRLSKIGIVKFSFKMPILTSGRRLAKEGAFTMGLRYTLNNFWMVVFRRPFTTVSREIRFENGGTVYHPESRWKEFFIAIFFTGAIIVSLGILVYLLYRLIVLIVAGIIYLASPTAGS